jgi:holliday junction resolvase YEN1
MGVPGLWDVRFVSALFLSSFTHNLKLLRPAGKRRSLTNLAVVDGFERNAKGVRGVRIGIDASIWFYHATYGREGENPELRTLFFRCSKLLGIPLLPLFVFDGPKRPSMKRNKKISGKSHWLTEGMKNIIEAFGFEWHTVMVFLFSVTLDEPALYLGSRGSRSRTGVSQPNWCH